jgi:hypothetical protein
VWSIDHTASYVATPLNDGVSPTHAPQCWRRRRLSIPLVEGGTRPSKSTSLVTPCYIQPPTRSGPLVLIMRKQCATAGMYPWNSRTGCSRRTGRSLGWLRACREEAGTSTTVVSECLWCRMRDTNTGTRSAAVDSYCYWIRARIRHSPSTPTAGPPSGPRSSTRDAARVT